MSNPRSRNVSCRVNSLAVSSILDAYIRRQEGNEKCIGALMGYFEGNCLVISDAFMVLHKENEDSGTLSLDKDYHRKIAALKKKITPTENVVGWFATCDEIEPSFVPVHSFFSTSSESRFVASQLLPAPVLLTVDPTLSNGDLNLRVSVMQSTVGADSLVQFHQLTLEPEAVGAGLSFLSRFSETVGGANSQSLEADLETLTKYTTDDLGLGESVSMALQEWRESAKKDESVSGLQSLAQSHKELVARISAVLNDTKVSQEIVI